MKLSEILDNLGKAIDDKRYDGQKKDQKYWFAKLTENLQAPKKKTWRNWWLPFFPEA